MKQITTFIFFVLVTTIVQAQQPAKVRAEVGPTAEELKRQKELETFIAKQEKLGNLMRENNISAPSLMGFATNDKEAINRIIKTNQDLINKINGIAGLRSLSMEVHTMSKALGHKTAASTDYVTHILEKANENIRRGKARLTELENTPKNTDNKNVTVIKPIAPPKNNWGFEKPKEEQKIEIAKINNKDIEILTDIDGNKYYVVTIGNLKWMGEDLRVTRYNDGTPIADASNLFLRPNNQNDPKQFEMISSPFFHKQGVAKYLHSAYNDTLIKLCTQTDQYEYMIYNGFVLENEGLCPKGWRLPTIEEIKTVRNIIELFDYKRDIVFRYSKKYKGFTLNGGVFTRDDYSIAKQPSSFYTDYWTKNKSSNDFRYTESFDVLSGGTWRPLRWMYPVRCVCEIK